MYYLQRQLTEVLISWLLLYQDRSNGKDLKKENL